MKKLLYMFSFFIFVTATGGAQTSDLGLKWGTYEKIGRKLYGKEIVHENEHFVYVIERESKNINLLFFQIPKPPELVLSVYNSHDLSKVKLNRLSFPKQGKLKYEYSFLKLIEIKGKLLLFVKAQNSKTDAVKLLAQELDSSGVQQGAIFELDEGVATKSPGLFKRTKLTNFSIQLTPDKSAIGLVKFNSAQDDDYLKIGYKLLNNSLKATWSGSVDLPYKKEFFDLSAYELGNQGELFLLGKAWKLDRKVGSGGNSRTKVSKQGKGDPNYSYKCLVFSTKNKSLKQVDLAVEGAYVTDVAMSYLTEKNKVYAAGFFSEQWGGSIRGSFTKLIDIDQAVVVQAKQKKFSAQFLQLFLNNRKVKRLQEGKLGNYELDNFRLDNFTVKKDGSAVMFAEMYFVQVNTSSSVDANGFMSTRTNYTYHYGDIIAIYLNPEGEVEWTAKVPKHQLSYNDGGPFSSYLINVEKENVYMIFNDHRSNIRRLKEGDDIRKMGSPKSSVTVVVNIDNQGVMTRNELFSAKESDLVFRPKSSWYQRDTFQSHKIYLFGLNYQLFSRAKFKLGLLTFPETTYLK